MNYTLSILTRWLTRLILAMRHAFWCSTAPYASGLSHGSFPRKRLDCSAGTDARCAPSRSEEHTSELQSRENLVCRLLLEKKKQPGHCRRRAQRQRHGHNRKHAET